MVNLSNEQQTALDEILETIGPVLVTGSAGTGKSVLLRALVGTFGSADEVAVAAPTGIAALNVSGLTLHSLFGFPVGTILFAPGGFRTKGSEYFRKLKLLVIDEVSMVRIDVMDAVDRALRYHRQQPSTPFGGLKVVFFGDPFQLPPIVTREDIQASWNSLQAWRAYKGMKHFFCASVFRDAPIRVLSLTEIQRQSGDRVFAEILNRVRIGRQTDLDLATLAESSMQGDPTDEVIRVYGKNHAVDSHNHQMLAALPGLEQSYQTSFLRNTEFKGRSLGQTDIWASLPTSANLKLKVGARVIFVKNDDQGDGARRWVNGSMGRITELSRERISVQKDDGSLVSVAPATWEARELAEFPSPLSPSGTVIRTAVTGWFIQFPVRLGWAITVHKSQGQTLDSAVLDFDDQYFEVGQAYVALSRVRSLDGLYFISNPKAVDILGQDINVTNFMRNAESYPFDSRRSKAEQRESRARLIPSLCNQLGYDPSVFRDRVEALVRASSIYSSAEKYIEDICILHEQGETKKAIYRVNHVFDI